MWKEALAARLR